MGMYMYTHINIYTWQFTYTYMCTHILRKLIRHTSDIFIVTTKPAVTSYFLCREK